MDPLLQKAKTFKFRDDSQTLENKEPRELNEDLERLKTLDDQLNPLKKRTFNGRDAALSLFGGGVFSGAVYLGLSTAGTVFSLANPLGGLVVAATAVAGTYLSGLLTESNNKAQVFEEYEVKVVKPKLYVMRMLNHHGVLTPAQKAEYERLVDELTTLRDREARFTEDMERAREDVEKAREDVEGLNQEKTALEDQKQKLEQEQERLATTNEELQRDKEGLGLKDAALTVFYKQALNAKRETNKELEAEKAELQKTSDELVKIQGEFEQTQNVWDKSKLEFEKQIEEVTNREKTLSEEISALTLANEQLKKDIEQKESELQKLKDEFESGRQVSEEDREKLQNLSREKEEVEKAFKQLEKEKNDLQHLYEQLTESKQQLQEIHDQISEEREELLASVRSTEEDKESVKKQLEELQKEFTEARDQFESDRKTIELKYQQQLQEKTDELTSLKEEAKRSSTRTEIRRKLLLGSQKYTEEARLEALAQVEEQKQELAKQQAELEELRREKGTLESRLERQRQAFIRHYGEARLPEGGDLRIVGDSGIGLKLQFFDFEDVSEKSSELDEVQLSTKDMAGRAAKRHLVNGLQTAERKLETVCDETRAEYAPEKDGEPTFSGRRKRMKEALETYRNEVLACKAEYEKSKGDAKARTAIIKNLDETVEVLNAGISRVSGEEDEFVKSAEEVDKLVGGFEQAVTKASTRELADRTTGAFQSVSHPTQEVRDLACARLVSSMAEKLVASTPTELPAPDDFATLEKMRLDLEEKKQALMQFHPDNLPMDTGRSISVRGKQYLKHKVSESVATLEARSRTADALEEVFPEEPRNEGGMVLAEKMLANPRICADVYSWFSSLQESHAGIKKTTDSFNYYTASRAGLETIRHDHGLVFMPTPFELLTVIKADLQEVNSRFTTQSVRQHRGKSTAKGGELRRKKLLGQCEGYLKREGENNFQRLRGQPTEVFGGELKPHAHKDVLDCFAKTGGCSVVHISEHSKTEEPAFEVYPVEPNTTGLMNTFFEGCVGRPMMRVNKKTREQLLSVDSHKAQPPVVFKNTQHGWKVSLGGNNWWVDPSVVAQNPELKVPFEWKNRSSQFQRDWIPLRDAHGNTAILVLRKSSGQGDRYFMYQPGDRGHLVPKPLGTHNPERERVEAELLYQAAIAGHSGTGTDGDQGSPELDNGYQLQSLSSNTMSSLSARQQQIQTSSAHRDVVLVKGMNRGWVKNADMEQLTQSYDRITRKAQETRHLAPLTSVDLGKYLDNLGVQENELRAIARTKREKQKSIQTYSKPRFATFSVGAGFDAASEKYFAQLRRQSGNGDNPVIETQQQQCQNYRDGIFRELQVFNGCELIDSAYDAGETGSPMEVEVNFAKVIKQNTDHCLRMQQQVEQLKGRLVRKIREQQEGDLESYTDQQLLDKAVMEFEKGNIVHGLYSDEKDIKLFVVWMQAENDLRLHNRMKRKLLELETQLAQIRKDAKVHAVENLAEYRMRCQNWNLEMALVASEMQAMQTRLDSYREKNLSAATRAVMSFERRAETVLRSGVGSDQVSEVESAIVDITLAMQNGHSMARVSQLGTGWGKSTMLQLWTDLACSLNVGHPERSVLVIAPTRNKLDLDRMLVRYYDQKGLEYQSLDVMKQYVSPAASRLDKKWWQGRALAQIHNQLLGLPQNTPEAKRDQLISQMRAPVGASIQDVQILVHLRRKLQNQPELGSADRVALRRLDGIIDLFRESMIFADEWDSALVPPLPHELEEVKVNVNKALQPLGSDDYQITREDIIHGHGTFIFGCKRKHLLSATTGTTYTAAVASGATRIDEIAQKCNTDPFTTSARVWHLLDMAEPVMVDSGKGSLQEQVYEKVVERVGTDRPVVMFNSHATGRDNFKQAATNFGYLSKARQKVAAKSGAAITGQKGMLYYDRNKKLCQYLPGDPRYNSNNKDVPVTREDEELIRANGGNMVDVCLGQSESVGTDAPQCLDSAGVFIGLFEQKKDGRFDLSAQQMGRLTRATRSMRKPQQFFMVVDAAAVRALEESEEKNAYLACHGDFEKKKQSFIAMFARGMPPAVEKALAAPVNVMPAVKDGTESFKVNVEKNLETELQYLEEIQWSKLEYEGQKLTENMIDALRELKTAQWQARVAYLELAARELASRNVNEHTVKCEKTLEQAAIDSAMDKAYSEEDNWLKKLTAPGCTLDTFEFEESVDGLPDDPKTDLPGPELQLTRRFIRENLVAEAGQRLASLPRRTVTEPLAKGRLSEQFDPDPMRLSVQLSFAGIKANGLKFEMNSPVDAVHAELKKCSLEALRDARKRLVEIQKVTCDEKLGHRGSSRAHNQALINPLLEIIDGRIREVDENSFDKAMDTETFLTEFYDRLFCAVSYLAIGDVEKSDRIQSIKDQLKGVWETGELVIDKTPETKNLNNLMGEAVICFPDYVPVVKYDTVNASVTVNRIKWVLSRKAKDKKAGQKAVAPETRTIPSWTLKSRKEEVLAGAKKAKREARKKNIEMLATPRLKPKFKWKVLATKPGETGREGSFEELSAICERGKEARHKLNCWEQAKAFCQPGAEDFERCVDEMQQVVLAQYEGVQTQIKRDLYQEDQTIQAQTTLKASPAA